MTGIHLIRRSLVHYWRGNLAVVLGVAVAVAVLAGALLVGASVRGTLRDLALARLGATDVVVLAQGFFREALADDVRADAAFAASFRDVAPVVMVEALVTGQNTGRRSGRVRVYGVDDRFWRFHGATPPSFGPREALVSAALAEDLDVVPGAPVLVRVELPSAVPLESLHGRKDDPGRTLRATVHSVLTADDLGEFSLGREQGRIRAVFVPIARLQAELDMPGRVNTLLLATRAGPDGGAAAMTPILRRVATPSDSGLTVRALPARSVLVVSADAGLIDATRVESATRAAARADLQVEPVFTYLANTIRTRTAEIPYSLVTARDLPSLKVRGSAASAPPPIVLNTWAATNLGARVGEAITLDYFVWEDAGRLATRSATFTLAGVASIGADDRDLAPAYPGITDSPSLDDWDPPFPFELRRIRKVDEEYWNRYRTTPKAFISLAEGQRLWGSRYGDVTSLRITAAGPTAGALTGDQIALLQSRYEAALGASIDPMVAGMAVRDVRAEALAASSGVTDFGQYFVYFSFFLVVSALVLAALFFKLGVEQRAREVGLYDAVGARPAFIRRQFLLEAVVLSGLGGLLGAAGAVGYAALIVRLLGTRWVDAVGTTAITLHVAPGPLLAGVIGGVAAAIACTWWSLRSLSRISARALLAGDLTRHGGMSVANGRSRAGVLAAGFAVGAVAAMGAGVGGLMSQSGAFFLAAALMLVAGLLSATYWYRRPPATVLQGRGVPALVRLGLRNAASRPSRSALSIAVIACATFILVAVDAFRKDAVPDVGPSSGLGGYALVVESMLPMAYDPSTPQGRDDLGLIDLDDVRFEPFRLRPGDDTSCLNLYQPTSPRVLGVRDAFVQAGRFRFGRTLAETPAERANPWTLLARTFDDGATPVIADANSLAYVLHKNVGDDIVIQTGRASVRLRVVAALADTVFQREVLIHESAFMRLFPEQEGYRFLLAEVPPGRVGEAATEIEGRLAPFAADAVQAAERLAEFHRVENTYLQTFQMLGGLGLLLGTVGLAAVLLRNVAERSRDLALFRAIGFEPRHVRTILLAESVSLLLTGLLVGVASAAVATVPAVIARGGRVPVSLTSLGLVGMVLLCGTLVTLLAARAAIHQPLLDTLRSE